MSRRLALISSITDLEEALLDLSDAWRRNQELVASVRRRLFHAGQTEQWAINESLALDNQLGTGWLASQIVQRMRALGLEAVLLAAREGGTVSETWVEQFSQRIERATALEE